MAKPRQAGAAPASTSLSIRIDLASGTRIGPGKIAVLEAIAQAGSISGAGRSLRMSYRRTWELVEDLNRGLGCAVVETAAGGSGGGGARLTEAGSAVVARYRAIEAASQAAAAQHMAAIDGVCLASQGMQAESADGAGPTVSGAPPSGTAQAVDAGSPPAEPRTSLR